jgi:cytochrome c oxidase subunit 2
MNFLKKYASYAFLSFSVFPFSVFADWGLNLPRGVTPFSQEVYDLHMYVLWIMCAIGLVVFGAMFYSILMHRKSRGAKAANWHHSTKVEIIWTVVPFAILIAVAIPATRSLIMMEDTANADMTIKITGYQWKWHYDYIGTEVKFFSTLEQKSNVARQRGSNIDPFEVDNYLLDVDNYLVVPTNKKIRFLTTAGDVIHAWWVPALGWKRDAIPGFINESWALIKEPGVYRGQCAELCGRDHGFMPIVVRAIPEDEYMAWLQQQAQASALAIQTKRSGDFLAVMPTTQ